MGQVGFQSKDLNKSLTGETIIHYMCDRLMVFHKRSMMYPNCYLGKSECDILEVTSNSYLNEYEVKVTRADFKKDEKKCCGRVSKFTHLRSGKRGIRRFYYVVPGGLITPDEVPDFAGLIYVEVSPVLQRDPDQADPYLYHRTVKEAQALPAKRATSATLKVLHRNFYFRYHAMRRLIRKLKTTV